MSQWAEPGAWLDQLPWRNRNKLSQAKAQLPARTGSRRLQAIADLIAYEDVRRIYSFASSLRRVKVELANLLIHKGLVHQSLNDMPGALSACDQSLGILRSLGLEELEQFMATALENKGIIYLQLREPTEAMAYVDQAIKIRERLGNRGRHDLRSQLARAYYNQVSTFAQLGLWDTALILSDKCIEIRRQIIEETDVSAITTDMKREFAMAYLQRAGIDFADASEGEKNGTMTWVQANNRRMLTAPFYHIAIQILEPLVPPLVDSDGRIVPLEPEGQYGDLPDLLADAYVNKAALLIRIHDPRALQACDLAIISLQRLVIKLGKHELADRLAVAYENKAVFLQDYVGPTLPGLAMYGQNNHQEALLWFDKAAATYEALIKEEGKQQFLGDWARARLHRARTLMDTGNRDRGTTEAREAFPILQAVMANGGGADLQGVLDWAKEALGEVLQRST